LLAAILKAHDSQTLLAGNIGRSALGALERLPRGTALVLELSSFQLEHLPELGASVDVAVVTNLTPNHLDWHGSAEAYAAAKQNLLRLQSRNSVAVLNRADPVTSQWLGHVRGELCTFATTPPARVSQDAVSYFVANDVYSFFCEQRPHRTVALCPCNALQVPGQHNRENAMAAVAAARSIGVSPAAIEEGLRSFRGLPHRLELVAEVDGVRYYNDSIATTPESTLKALEALDGPITLIAGGSDKGASFAALGAAVRFRVRRCLLTGTTAPRIARAIGQANQGLARSPEIVRVRSLEEAVANAATAALPGESVLLSPACASYDAFVNFAARGDCFRQAVARLRSTTPALATGAL
jgi:UDP-N-acetylmuramoylalanine--D-glutamate ligase